MRSKNCVLLAHCILAQTVRADGCEKAPAIITQVVEFLMREQINIIQMPCPETLFIGLPRPPHGKKWYEQHGFRDHCRKIADDQAEYCKTLEEAGNRIVAILGVEFSPACSTIQNSGIAYRPYGIYIEELVSSLGNAGIHPKTISINPGWKHKMEQSFAELVEPNHE